MTTTSRLAPIGRSSAVTMISIGLLALLLPSCTESKPAKKNGESSDAKIKKKVGLSGVFDVSKATEKNLGNVAALKNRHSISLGSTSQDGLVAYVGLVLVVEIGRAHV